jgi:hypothetical protein
MTIGNAIVGKTPWIMNEAEIWEIKYTYFIDNNAELTVSLFQFIQRTQLIPTYLGPTNQKPIPTDKILCDRKNNER